MELVLYVGSEHVPVGTDVFLQVVGYGDDEVAVAGDGVVQLAAMELCQTDAVVALHGLEEESGEDLDGVGALLVDVIAGVAAYESLDGTFQEEAAVGGLLAGEGEVGGRVTASGTADEYLALVLRVEVDEVVACHETGLHALGTCEARLLVAGEDTLDGTVPDIVGSQDGQLDGATDAVVSTEGGTLCRQPLTVDIGLDGVLVEVELHIHKLVAHHIHVALQDHRLAVFHAFGGRLAD